MNPFRRAASWPFSQSDISSLYRLSAQDQTRTGHILGDAEQRSEAPERQMTVAKSCILRLLTHLAMLQGAVRNDRVRPRTTYPSQVSTLRRDVLTLQWGFVVASRGHDPPEAQGCPELPVGTPGEGPLCAGQGAGPEHGQHGCDGSSDSQHMRRTAR